MDGRTRRFYGSTTRKLAIQLRPQPRFVAPPAPPAAASNVIRPFVRPLPTPLSAVKAVPTLALPKLGLAGLAFGLGFFIGDALINPLLGQESVFDWGVFNSPDGGPEWGTQEPLPDTMQVTTTGEMGSDGADIAASITYGDSRAEGSDGCTAPIDRDISQGSSKYARAGYGQLRYFQGAPGANNCGALSYGVEALLNIGSSSGTQTWETIRSISAGNWSPEGGITYANFQLEYVPRGEPLGFVPEPIWEPAVEPRPGPEPLPEIAPVPEPRVKPMAPPLMPQAPPNVLPVPLPTPTPTIQPAPSPLPQTNPALVPNRPGTPRPTIPGTGTQQISNSGKLVPQPGELPSTTPTDAHFPVPGQKPVRSGGVRPTIDAIASEVGRIEQKSANIQQEVGSILDHLGDLADIIELIEFIKSLFEKPFPEEEYVLNPVCESDAEPTVVSIPEEMWADRLISYQTVVPQLLQAHLGYKTPTCRTRPQLQGDWRTIEFISDETSPHGRDRLRKRFRYRSMSGLGLGEIIDHWANFTWDAGPVCVQHSGASWGTPQVWASSIDEGKRVIRHAAGESGIDPDQVGQWTVSGSSSPRIGVSGTMRVRINKGTYCITARDGSENRPIVGTV